MAKPKAWERSPTETEDAFAFWLVFRDMAYPEGIAPGSRFVPRSLRRVSEIMESSPYHVGQLAKNHGWHARALAYDRHVDELRMGARATELERATVEHTRLIASMKRIAEAEISKHLERAEEDPTVSLTSLKEAVELTERIVKLDRLVLGGATERVDDPKRSGQWNREKRWNLEALSLEDLEALERARERAGGPEPEPEPLDAPTKH
jgi:hypothetical protein